MKNIYSHNNFSNDSSNNYLIERDLLLLEIEVYIPHGKVLHNNVDMRFVLKGFFYSSQKLGMPNFFDQLALQHIELSDFCLLYYFHRIELAS